MRLFNSYLTTENNQSPSVSSCSWWNHGMQLLKLAAVVSGGTVLYAWWRGGNQSAWQTHSVDIENTDIIASHPVNALTARTF